MSGYPEPTWTVARVFHNEIADDYVPERVRALRQIDPDTVKDPTFRDIARFVQGLRDDQIALLTRFARMIAIDSVASVLGLIEGCGYAEGLEDDFRLTYASQDVTRDLLHAFLYADEVSLER